MTNGLTLPRDQVGALRASDVQRYLSSRGWVPDTPASSPRARVYHYPGLPDAEVLLPLSRDLADYANRMGDALAMLSAVERRSVWDVLGDLSAPPSDVLRLRMDDPEASLGNLPLDKGIELLRGGRDLLLSAACSTSRPQAYHPEMTLKDAIPFIKSCRLGQTERGSFVARIITPVSPSLRSDAMFPDDEEFQDVTEPFARRVTTRLMTSLECVDAAIREERLDPVLDGVSDGVSANLCEALLAMKPPGDQGRLEVAMSWSRSRPRLPEGVPSIVTFAEADFLIIEEAGKKLRERAKPRRERFEGKVVELRSEARTLFDDLAGKITFRSRVDGQAVRIKVLLGREDYVRACDAHRDERRVAVTGIIHHDAKVRVYELSQPGDFEVLSDL